MPWLILALMGAGTFIYGLTVHAALLCLLVKPLPVLALLGWLHDAPPSDYRRWISLGLIFGSSRNPGKHRNKNADLMDDVRASKHI